MPKTFLKVGFYLCNVIGTIFMIGGFVFGYIFVYSFDFPYEKIPFLNFLTVIILWSIAIFFGFLAYNLNEKYKKAYNQSLERDKESYEIVKSKSKSIASKEVSAVLIVEDDTQVAKMLKDFFSSEGFKSYIAFDGVEAIEVLKNNHIDIVVTDVMMPRLTGLDLTKIVKKKYDSDVIIFTGYEKNCNYEQAIKIGASDFFYKPFKLKDMLDSVKRIMEKRLSKSLGS